MLRAFILLVLAAGVTVIALPFVISSLYVDERGIDIAGRVYFKRETIKVPYTGWERSSEATIQYDPPDSGAVSFFTLRLAPERYDALHVGQTVNLHYLQRKDTPTVPLAHVLREINALPMVRLADQRAFSGLRNFFTGRVIFYCEALAAFVVLLFIWHMAGSRLFGWAIGICIALAVISLMVQGFPRPMPRPTVDVRKGTGRVKSISNIDRLFEGRRARGFNADQPVDVVGIEFIPAGRTEAVVAVDLIDSGSLPGLKENSTVPIEYEAQSPRTAYIQAATRTFVSRNLTGIAVQCLACLAVLIVVIGGAQFISRAFNRLIERRRTG